MAIPDTDGRAEELEIVELTLTVWTLLLLGLVEEDTSCELESWVDEGIAVEDIVI